MQFKFLDSKPAKVPKTIAQYSRIEDFRQYRVHYLGAILPRLSVLGARAIVLGILEVQVMLQEQQQIHAFAYGVGA